MDNKDSPSSSAAVNVQNTPVRNGQFHTMSNERVSRFGRPISVPSRSSDCKWKS